MKNSKTRLFLTYIFLGILLFIRFPSLDLFKFIEQLVGIVIPPLGMEYFGRLQENTLSIFYGYSLILVAIVIYLNRENVKQLNIDKWFVFLFLGGALAFKWDTNWLLETLTLLSSLGLLIFYIKGCFNFDREERNRWKIISIITALSILTLMLVISFAGAIKPQWIVYWFLLYLPLVIVEEFLFRGLLWMFLENQNLSNKSIIALQALFFWFNHVNAHNDVLFFWVIIPIISIFLGVLVWRSNSITPSILFHVLFNIFFGLIEARAFTINFN